MSITARLASKQLVDAPTSGFDERKTGGRIHAWFSIDTVRVRVRYRFVPQLSHPYSSALRTALMAKSSKGDRRAHDTQTFLFERSTPQTHAVGTLVLSASRLEGDKRAVETRESSRQCPVATAHWFVLGRD